MVTIQSISAEKSILWEMIVMVIINERVHKNVCPVLNGWGAPETPCIHNSFNIKNSFVHTVHIRHVILTAALIFVKSIK